MTKYLKLKNVDTEEYKYVPAGAQGRFYNSVRKILQFIEYNWKTYYVCHVTLTVAIAQELLFANEMGRATDFIRKRIQRAGGEFLYVWVREIQEERLEKRGELVIHYHMLCFYSKPRIMPDAREIQESWGLGNVKITAPKLRSEAKAVVGYLGQYLGKGFDYGALEVKKAFSSSQIPQIYKLSPARLAAVMGKVGLYTAKLLKCSFTRVWYAAIAGLREKKFVFDWWGQSRWVCAGIVKGEPF